MSALAKSEALALPPVHPLAEPWAGLDGPSRTIIVEPQELPSEAPSQPVEAPAEPVEAPVEEPIPV